MNDLNARIYITKCSCRGHNVCELQCDPVPEVEFFQFFQRFNEMCMGS